MVSDTEDEEGEEEERQPEDREETTGALSAQIYDDQDGQVLQGVDRAQPQVSRNDILLNFANSINSEENNANETDDEYEAIDIDDGEAEEECYAGYVDNRRWAVKTFTAEAEGAAGLDSCCSRTIMGTKWYTRYKELLRIMDRELMKEIKGPFKTKTNFLFGDGGKKNSLGR